MNDMKATEEWRQVVIDELFKLDYEVSSLGRVRSQTRKNPGKILKGGEGPESEVAKARTVWISNPETDYSMRPRVDQMVATAFLGPKPSTHRLVHKNGCVWDDRAENLAYEDTSIPVTVLEPLLPVDGREAAEAAQKLAWEKVTKAHEALNMALARAIRATKEFAEKYPPGT